jgi:excisionase family DNA binding protein
MVRAALKPEPGPEDSITVNDAARRLCCDHTTVRALLRAGELSGHRVGKAKTPGGVRVKLWSVIEYEERNAIGGQPPEAANDAPARRPRRRDPNPAHGEAMAYLRSIGIDL